ncbi:SRPBCC domain-containing protein [bacterium]|nr:SRPBCC domain-containing protein [bacterium]
MATETNKKRASVAVDVRVPAKVAWRAISDTRELQIWFAQQVNVDIDEQQLSFGGKFLPFLRYDERPEQEILEINPEEMTLSFTWPVRQREGEIVETVVHFRVSGMEENTCRLDVDHIVGDDDLTDDDLRNLWTLLLNGFVFHMEGASAWVRPEFTHKRGKDFRLDFWTTAKREEVYETLTTVDGIRGFFAPQVKKIELNEGGILDLGWDQLPVVEVEENVKFSFGWREVADEDPNLVVRWELKDEGNGTRVTLTEGSFTEPVVLSTRSDYDGWAAVMNDLKRFLETRRHPIFLSILIEPHTEPSA